jgi:hypothetical protein
MSESPFFQVERAGQTIVVTPLVDLFELNSDELLNCDPGGAIWLLESQQASNVVIDCRRLVRCCSSGIAVFIRLGKRTLAHHGRMALCNQSVRMRQVYYVLNLTTLWPTFDSLEEALAYVQEGAGSAESAGAGPNRDSLSR